MLRSFKIYTCTNGTLGLHLSRAPWDPYPWVSSIQKDSTSYQAGVRIGDCLLELNSQDVLGMKISEIAALLKNHWLNESSNYVTVVIWRNKCNSNNANTEHTTANDCNKTFNGDGSNNHNHHADDGDGDGDDDDEDEENNAHNINQQSLQKFATCLQHIAQLLECPVCLEVIKPPGWQCCNGHVLCNNCRNRSEKCPVCRVPLGPRGRCLLSDKLFTLLADSFPCDGVRSNKNSPKDRRKCSTEFHNQPKMAIVQKQQQLQQEKYEQQAGKKSKDFLFTSLRQGSRKMSNSKANEQGQTVPAKTENNHPSMQKHGMYDISVADAAAAAADSSTVVVVGGGSIKRNSSNRESSLDYNSQVGSIVEQQPCDDNVKGVVATTTFCYTSLQEQPTKAAQQCHCLTCSKSNRVAIVNNVTTTAATATTANAVLNKYILRIPSQEHVKNIVQQHEEKYKNYQCPTGKLCCLNVYVMPPHDDINTNTNTTSKENNVNNETNKHIHLHVPGTNKKTKQSVLKAEEEQQSHQVNGYKLYKILKNEWDILVHLTEDHQLPVNQYYAEYGQRIRVQVQCLIQQNSITCLNLRASQEGNVAKEEKFFIACIPLEINCPTQTPIASNLAIFLYHMNPVTTNDCTTPTTALNAELNNFETIIENPLTGIKWFGCALPLTTPWSYIHAKQHFYQHNVLQNHFLANSNAEAAVSDNSDDAFVIVVKRKLEIKTK